MKRAAFLILILSLPFLFPGSLWADEVTVPDDYPTIQQAIDEAENISSLTIIVKAGTYGPLWIAKGAAYGSIDPALSVIHIKAHQGAGVVIEGGDGDAIHVGSASTQAPHQLSVRLSDLTICNGGGWGIHSSRLVSLQLENCNIYGNTESGLYAKQTGTLELVNTKIYNNQDYGLHLENTNNVTINGGEIYGNGDGTGYDGGAWVVGASNLSVTGNVSIRDNLGHGMNVGGSSAVTTVLDHVSFVNNSGCGFTGGSLGDATFTNVDAAENGEQGVYIHDGIAGDVHTTLSYDGGSVYSNGETGVSVSALGSSVSLTNLDIYENSGVGLSVSFSNGPLYLENLNIHDNVSSSHYGGGIRILGWFDAIMNAVEVRDNSCEGYGGGIYIAGGKEEGMLGILNVTITGNTAEDRGGGMYLTLASNTTCGLNDIEFNGNKVLSNSLPPPINYDGGGGLYVAFQEPGTSYPRPPLGIANCRFINNEGDFGAAAYFSDGCYVSISGGEVTGNKPYDQVDTHDCSALFFMVPGRVSTTITNNTTDYDIYFKRNKWDDNPNLDATSSWWGTMNESEIEARIYDHNDNDNRGWVWTWPPLPSAPDPTDTVPFPYVDCEGSPIPEEPQEGYGTIRGHVVDQPSEGTRVGIPDAQVQLYVEGPGWKRFVKATVTDEAGFYAFNNLDIRSELSNAYPPPLDRVRRKANYTVKVSQASLSDKRLFNDDEREGYSYYKDQEKCNIAVGPDEVVEVDFVMEPELAKARKLWIVNVLSGFSPNNYEPAESGIAEYVDGLESGSMTGIQEEALKRAVEAESALVYAYSYASDMADLFLESLGMLVGNLFGEFWSGNSKGDVAKKKVEASSLSSESKEALTKALEKVDVTNKAIVKAMSYAVETVFAQIEDSLPDGVASTATAILKDFMEKLTSSGLKGSGTNVIQEAISQVVKLFKPMLMDGSTASYCKTTSSTITEIIEPQLRNWGADDEEQFLKDVQRARDLQQQIVIDGGGSVEDVVALVNATIVQKKMEENMEMLSAILTASGVGAEFGEALDVGSMVFKITKYITNAGAIAAPLKTMFNELPLMVENVACASFGLSLLPQSVPGQPRRTPLGFHAMAVDTSDWTNALDAAAGNAASGCNAFLSAFNQDAETALHLLTTEDSTGLLDLLDTLETEEDTLLAKASAVRSVDATQEILDFVETMTHLVDLKARLVGTMVDLFLGTSEGSLLGVSDPRYQGLFLSIKGIAGEIQQDLSTLETRADALVNRLANGEMPPAVQVAKIEITNPDGEPTITASPQMLTVKATIRNIGSVDVENLSVRLNLGEPDSFGEPQPSVEQGVGTGGILPAETEATVTWTIEYKGDLSEGMLWLSVRPLENGGAPASFVGFFAMGAVSVEGSLIDGDGDGMPDVFEARCGLDTGRDDAGEDKDGDGLSNYEEWRLGLRADLPDTDSDGLSDGAELNGLRGFFTDPLNQDTDGDGAVDGQDGAPLDHLSTDPAPTEPQSHLVLSKTQIVLSRFHKYETVTVSDTGSGELQWVALLAHPGLISLRPATGTAGTAFTVSTPDGFDFDYTGSIRSSIYVFDITGARKPPEVIEVIVKGDQELMQGDVNGDSEVDLADAVFTLRIVGGLVPGFPAYPDIRDADANGDGKIGTAEAIYILQWISGLRD